MIRILKSPPPRILSNFGTFRPFCITCGYANHFKHFPSKGGK